MVDSMRGGFFAVNIKPEHRGAFIESSVREAKGVIDEEAGVFQFQIMVDEFNPNRFYFYEVFRDEAAVQEHWQTDVFKTWWTEIEPMLDGEIETVAKMQSVFPSTRGFEVQKPGLSNW